MDHRLWVAKRAAEVAGHMVLERVRAPKMSTRRDVPVDGRKLTVEWLTDVLCREVPGAAVTSFQTPGGSVGTSTRTALRVTYNRAGETAGLPTALYTKTTADFSQRLMLGAADVLRGETQFFLTYRPAVEMEAPRGYWGAVHDGSWRSIVMMEDIAESKGATFIQPTTALTRTQVEDVLRNMAAYHGTWWEAPELSVLKTPRDHYNNVAKLLDMGARHAVGMERAKSVIPAALQGQAERAWRGTQMGLDMCTDVLPRTLLHGDSHAGQTYITADGRMGLTDWQATMQGGWVYDVAYFIGSACEPEDRREWENDLLETYLNELARNGGKAPDLDEAKLRYRQAMFYPLSAWTFTIGRAFYQPKMQPEDICLSIIGRLATAIDDLDSFGALGI
ncbi:phosphotransferase [Nocardia sp. NPDC059246]|uniref:phosphotransferase n=1 Tax=unclassified Nocardia TaxID=2637762 RepID=UPI003688B8A5